MQLFTLKQVAYCSGSVESNSNNQLQLGICHRRFNKVNFCLQLEIFCPVCVNVVSNILKKSDFTEVLDFSSIKHFFMFKLVRMYLNVNQMLMWTTQDELIKKKKERKQRNQRMWSWCAKCFIVPYQENRQYVTNYTYRQIRKTDMASHMI